MQRCHLPAAANYSLSFHFSFCLYLLH
jgi:hypothetical protein